MYIIYYIYIYIIVSIYISASIGGSRSYIDMQCIINISYCILFAPAMLAGKYMYIIYTIIIIYYNIYKGQVLHQGKMYMVQVFLGLKRVRIIRS